MNTHTHNVRITSPNRSTGDSYTAPVTLPTPPFALPTEREVREAVHPTPQWVFRSVRGAQ